MYQSLVEMRTISINKTDWAFVQHFDSLNGQAINKVIN
jgi:hypothetical protein